VYVKITASNASSFLGTPSQNCYFLGTVPGPNGPIFASVGSVLEIPRELYDEQCMTRMGQCTGPGLFPFPGNPWSQQDNKNFQTWAQFSGGPWCSPIPNE
jgi:hypothetical protein